MKKMSFAFLISETTRFTEKSKWKIDENGKLAAKEIETKKIITKELCVDDICVTREQFKEVFEMGQANTETASSTVSATSTGTTTPQ